MTNYYIDGDEVLFSSNVDETKKTIKTIVVSLNNKRIISTNEIDTNYKQDYNRYILEMRRHNNKTYVIMSDYENNEHDTYMSEPLEKDYYIYVINEKNNNILYGGKIKGENIYNVSFGIVKDDEL